MTLSVLPYFIFFIALTIFPNNFFVGSLGKSKPFDYQEGAYESKLPSFSFTINNQRDSLKEIITILPYDEFRKIPHHLEILKIFLNHPEILESSNITVFSESDLLKYDLQCRTGYENFLSPRQKKAVTCNLCWIIIRKKFNDKSKKNCELIGRIAIKEDFTFNDNNENDLSIALRKDYQSKGLGTKLCRWVLEWFKENYPKVSHIQWVSDSENILSQKLATKLGFQKCKSMQLEKTYEVYRLNLREMVIP